MSSFTILVLIYLWVFNDNVSAEATKIPNSGNIANLGTIVSSYWMPCMQ